MRKIKYTEPCFKCGDTAHEFLLFNELEGDERICARCIFKALTGEDAPPWKKLYDA